MKTYSKEECKEIINKLNQELIEDLTKEERREYLSRENNLEARDVKGYHGRELLELLQNADDAYQKSINLGERPAENLVVKIKYFDNKLTISNTGTFFDETGIDSIMLGNNSNKGEEYIGNKGTGFRSVLNWADDVKIFSGNFNIEFSKEIAESFFDQIKDFPQIKKQLEKHPNLHVPMLSVAKYLDKKPIEYSDNETTIELNINPDKQKDNYNVDKQIHDMDMNILLFLPNTSEIRIETNNEKIIYKKDKRKIDENASNNYILSSVTITKNINGDEQSENYKLFERTLKDKFKDGTTGNDEMKKLGMAIAVTDNKTILNNAHLYTYFPLLETKSPFNCIMHATYELGNQRNTIDNSSNNSKIIVHQMKFLLDIAQMYYIKNDEIEKAVSLIIPNNISLWNKYNKKFSVGFSSFDLEDKYLEMLKDVRVFQTVNNDLLSINDNPKVIGENIPDYFKGDNFNSVIKLHNHNELLLLNLLKDYFEINLDINESELSNIISNESVKWSVEQRVNCFIWWCEITRHTLPTLLQDRDGNWLNYKDSCYFLDGSFNNVQIPSWAKIKSLKEEYQKELINQAGNDKKVIDIKNKEPKNTTSRIISQNGIYNCIDFSYIDRSTIISAINKSVDTYKEGVDFVNWLWQNYCKEEPSWVPPGIADNRIKYKFPTFDKDIATSDAIFIGEEYGNVLGDLLFDNSYKQFCSIDEINITDEQKEDFVFFILKFGVNKYPQIRKETVPIQNYKEYYDYIYQIINMSVYKADTTYIKEINCSFPFIANLTKILENVSTIKILEWIKNDAKLSDLLRKKELYQYDYRIDFTLNRGKAQLYNRKPVKNYILYVFNHTKWVDISGNRYSPVEVLLDVYSKNNQLLKDLTPVITEEYKKELISKLNITIDELNSILTLFDFKTNILELSSNDFYGIMLKLPSLPNKLHSIEIYKSIYYLLDHADINSARFEESDNKTLFFKEGKLYTQKRDFVTASKVYLPSTKILNKEKYDIINKSPRGNSENFIEVFGCQKYERNFLIDPKSIKVSLCNDSFQKDFSNFKLYASAYNSLNKNIEKSFKNISITLVEQISVKYSDGKIENINDEYVEINESNTKWYITIFSDNYNVNKLSSCIENIFSNIANTPGYDSGKIGEIFRARTEEDRRFLIENAGMIIQPETDFASEYKDRFEKAVYKINPNIDLEKYDIDYNNIQCDTNIEKIIELSNELSISSLNEIYNNGFDYKFDLTNYYKVEIRNYIDREKKNYKNYLYSLALEDIEKQNSFIDDCYKFENYNISERVEDILDIKKFVEIKFGIWDSNGLEDADEIYKRNYVLLNPNREVEDNIRNNDEVRTLVFFNKKDEFEKWLINEKSLLESEKQPKKDPYEEYRNFIPEVENISYSDNSIKKQSFEKTHKKRAFSESSEAKKRKNQKILGNKGELIVYNLLCDKYGKENVFPKSEAFVSLGILEAGQEVSAECDIEYKGKDGKIYYVEVKSGDEFSFNISQDELNFAKDKKNYYKLYIVFNFDKDKPKCKLVDDKFWENSRYKQEPIIETIHITF